MAYRMEIKRDQSPSGDHPNMSDLRIVLLGKNASENNRVGNLILGKNVFGKKMFPTFDVEEHSGKVEGRNITVISTIHLLSSQLKLLKLAQKVSVVSRPEPDVIILVLQHEDFSERKRDRLPSVLNCFGEQVMKRTMIVTTDDEKVIAKLKPENEYIQEISTKCGGCLQLTQNTQRSQILKKVDEILTRSGFKETQQSSSLNQANMGRSCPDFSRPISYDLRIVLLGKIVSENSRVRTLILGEDTFESEASSAERRLQQHRQGVGRHLEDRYVTVINSSQLLQSDLSLHQITQTVRECVNLSDPGPHAFILVLQYSDFTEEDMRRVKYVLKQFSEEAIKHTIVITTDQESYGSYDYLEIKSICHLIKDCGGAHLQLDERKPEWRSEIFEMVDKKLKENQEDYLTCDIFHDVKGTPMNEEQNISEEENDHRKSDEVSANVSEKQKLNLVLCGSDATLKDSVSKLFRGKKMKPLHERDIRSECVKKEKIHGHQISLVELPALSQLSVEEVMRQTHHCVSLCDPGVHVFILIIPVGPLTDEDKTEIEIIQKIFYSREHFILLFTTELTVEGFATDFVKSSPESQRLISRCGGQHRVIGLKEPENSKQIPKLLEYIEHMKTQSYSPHLYVKAQENRVRHELEEQHKEELKRMEDEIKELTQKIHSEVMTRSV